MSYESDTATGGTKTISALFDTRADATEAIDRLHQAGITQANVRLVEGSDDGIAGEPIEHHKSFWEKLGDFFFPEDDRYTYAEGLSRGGFLVTVHGLSGTQYHTALDILDDEGSVDLDDREASWRAEGWGGYETSSYADPTRQPAAAAASAATTGVILGGETDMDRNDLSDDMRADEVDRTLDQPAGVRDRTIERARVRSYAVDPMTRDPDDLKR